jgi:hypothetical protein
MYALAAMYITHIRGTGIGTAVAVGGSGTFWRPIPATSRDRGGPPAYFSTFGIRMVIVFMSLAVIDDTSIGP